MRRWPPRSTTFFVPQGREPGVALATYRERLRGRADRRRAGAVLTDHTFRLPAIRMAEAQLQHQPNVWMYLFTFASPAFGGVLGACHALEVPFVWDNLDAQGAPMFVGDVGEAHRRLARLMGDAWTAFARHGDPVRARSAGLARLRHCWSAPPCVSTWTPSRCSTIRCRTNVRSGRVSSSERLAGGRQTTMAMPRRGSSEGRSSRDLTGSCSSATVVAMARSIGHPRAE